MTNLYFWLGEDAEVEELTLEEFERKIQEKQEENELREKVGLSPR